ncbi:hypothetical protein M9Y10_021107 [Tritrichomonas musculus]|uniref:SMP-LTD domain-containing protein n=1 Tax=Tritrichomonas musculus TaxID=1915356 RepID=A0ABR2HD06_9EUKA
MFETLLNFFAGVIFGTIVVLMILFFMMCMLWCRPVPRVPIAKNLPPNKIASEVEETSKWISIFNNNELFQNWFRSKLASSIQSEIESCQNFAESKSDGDNNNNNLTFKVNKVSCSSPIFSTVKTIDTVEGKAISSFPISFSSDIVIETEAIIDSCKKIKSVATISTLNPILQITIPYEKGIILIELIIGKNAQISFGDDIITEVINDMEDVTHEKVAKLSNQEEAQIEAIKKSLSLFLKHISLKFDVDTIPAEAQTIDKFTETDIKEEVTNQLDSNKGENSPVPEITEKTNKSSNQIDSANETENIKEVEKQNENEDKNEIEEKNDNGNENEDDDDDEDEDDDAEEDATFVVPISKRKIIVDEEIQQIVEQATSLINVDKPASSTPENPQ